MPLLRQKVRFKSRPQAFLLCLLTSSLLFVHNPMHSQELEPRSMTNIPVRTNFAMLSYTYAEGSILFDPALSLKDVYAWTNTTVAAWVRSYNFFGMGAKGSIILPAVSGYWKGTYQDEAVSTSRIGIADLRLNFSFNFIGSPALTKSEFREYRQKTIVGFSMQMVLPTGQYFDDKLINLGSNRWAFRPQFNVSHKFGSWYLEYAINTWFYTANDSSFGGNLLEQKPLATLKLHGIKSFKKGIWAAVGVAYAYGGRIILEEEERDASISNVRLGAILVVPVHPQHSFKLTAIYARRFAEGADFDSYNLAYQFMWNRKKN